MDPIEHNNRERIKDLGSRPAAEMTKRERLAMEAMSAVISSGKYQSDTAEIASKAIEIADEMIKKLNQ